MSMGDVGSTMATIVEFRVPIDQLALAHTFASIPDLRIEIERFAAHDVGSAMPFVWVTADDFGAFEAALDEDPTVETFETLAEFDDERFYRMNWIDRIDFVIHLLVEEEGSITRARTTGDFWQLQVLFPEHDSLSRTYEFCEESGLSLTVESIYELDTHEGSQFGLTEQQRTTLVEAKKQGYYDVPRSVSLAELADSLDVSHQALSERFRRAHANLIDRTIAPAGPETENAIPSVRNER
jgi:predicted DNA binding protein